MKRLTFFRFAPAAVMLALVLGGCGTIRSYAVNVNGTVISRSSLDSELSDLAHNAAYRQSIDQQHESQGGPGPVEGTTSGTYSQSFVSFVLTQRVEYQLVHDELVRRHSLPTAGELRLAGQSAPQGFDQRLGPGTFQAFPSRYQRTLIQRQAEISALVRTFSDTETRRYFDSHPGDFTTDVCVRHILISDKDSKGNLDLAASKAHAQRVKAQLDGGADFAALAKAESTDTQSAVNGGKLPGSAPDGCLTSDDASQLVQPFAQAMSTLPVNQVSDPVQTQFGYHLIQVTDRKVAPYDAQAAQFARQTILLNLLKQRLTSAHIKVNPEFGSFDKSRAVIVPPRAPATTPRSTTPPPTG